MNLKLLTFALATGLAAAHPPPPDCTVGADAPACTLPDGGEGMFVCHPHPFHDGHWFDHHHGEEDHGGILGAFHHAIGHIIGHPSHDDHDHHHHHPDHDHHHPDHHHDGHEHHHHKRRQLRSGSSSSSSSSSSSRSGFGPRGGSHDSSRSGRHHHGSMMRMGPHGMGRMMHRSGRGGWGPHHHGRHGHHGPHGPPGKLLSDSHCVPVDGPPPPHPFPFGDHPHPHDPPTCGCCGDVCPVQLDCGCSCDLTDCDGNVLEEGAGIWVTVTLKDQSTTAKKCVPAGSYADANRVQCVTDCLAEDLLEEEEENAMEIMEEDFGEVDLEAKESRD